MFQLFTNPLPFFLTVAASFGVLLHDTSIDHATTTALSMPSSIANFGGAELAIKLSEPHVHPDHAGFVRTVEQLRSGEPRLQTRIQDKKYVAMKKIVADALGSEYHLPRV